MTSRKKTKGPFERVVDAISDFMGGSMSDMTDEIPSAKKVKKAKAHARGPAKKKRASGRRRASVKRTAKNRTAKKS
jgi:hypothetical protein